MGAIYSPAEKRRGGIRTQGGSDAKKQGRTPIYAIECAAGRRAFDQKLHGRPGDDCRGRANHVELVGDGRFVFCNFARSRRGAGNKRDSGAVRNDDIQLGSHESVRTQYRDSHSQRALELATRKAGFSSLATMAAL